MSIKVIIKCDRCGKETTRKPKTRYDHLDSFYLPNGWFFSKRKIWCSDKCAKIKKFNSKGNYIPWMA